MVQLTIIIDVEEIKSFLRKFIILGEIYLSIEEIESENWTHFDEEKEKEGRFFLMIYRH